MNYVLSFNKVDIEKNEINRLLSLVIGHRESQMINVKDKIRNHYKEINYPDVVLDFSDEGGTILDDYRITYEDAKDLAKSMGWTLDEEEIL